MIHVCWHEGTDGFTKTQGRSGYSCCTVLNQLFDTYDCLHWSTFQNLPAVSGAVVVIQGGNEKHRVAEINRDLALLQWVIAIVIGDDSCDFPLEQLQHPNMKVWFQMPRPGYTKADRALILGCSRETPHHIDHSQERTLDWFFAGQDTHARRHQCLAQLREMKNGLLRPTGGFNQGMEHKEYFSHMARAKVIPCPGGPASPDTFRMWESIEMGCVPIVDAHTLLYPQSDYWEFVLGLPLPFPLIYDWSTLPKVMEETLANWEDLAASCRWWWVAYRAKYFGWLEQDIRSLGGWNHA